MFKSVQEGVEVEAGRYHIFVVPCPYHVATSGLDCFGADIARHPKLRRVSVADTILLQQPTRLPLLSSGRYMLTGFCRTSKSVLTPWRFSNSRISSVFRP